MIVETTEDGLRVTLHSEEETERLGRAIAGIAEPGMVIGLIGTLGAGKTRLVRAIAENLGVDPTAISSPTFVLIHEYEGTMPIFHFDVYRLGSPGEFEDLGAADYWQAGGLCLVEWADRVRELMPPTAWFITIDLLDATARQARIRVPMTMTDRARVSKLTERLQG